MMKRRRKNADKVVNKAIRGKGRRRKVKNIDRRQQMRKLETGMDRVSRGEGRHLAVVWGGRGSV